ncbi:MAG: DUF4286 family protein [Bacteroidetes bacterium]|nr:DUF4286 family protein [Bacteroidota bacterium]
MIIYNVTVNIDADVHDEWLHWMKSVHIPNVLSTGCFLDNKICKVLVDEEKGITYSIQYTCANMDSMKRYQQEFAAAMQKEHMEKYANKFVAFRTLLEVVSNQKV